MEKGGSEKAPKFSPFDLPRKTGEIWGFLWDTILSHAKPSAWHRGLARGSWLGGKLIPLMADQGRSSCVAEVLPFVPTAEPSKSQSRKPKCGKGTHCSRNAYMLVYRLQAREKSLAVEVPAFLQELVERDNCKFEEWCNEMAEMRKQSVARGKIKHEEVKELYQRLPAEAGL